MYNSITRSLETEPIPVCRQYGPDFAIYSPLAGSLSSGKYKNLTSTTKAASATQLEAWANYTVSGTSKCQPSNIYGLLYLTSSNERITVLCTLVHSTLSKESSARWVAQPFLSPPSPFLSLPSLSFPFLSSYFTLYKPHGIFYLSIVHQPITHRARPDPSLLLQLIPSPQSHRYISRSTTFSLSLLFSVEGKLLPYNTPIMKTIYPTYLSILGREQRMGMARRFSFRSCSRPYRVPWYLLTPKIKIR
jgi:hypothetical protein